MTNHPTKYESYQTKEPQEELHSQSLTLPLFTEARSVHVFVLRLLVLTLSTIFIFNLRTVMTELFFVFNLFMLSQVPVIN